jgi:hypothetical protein
MRSREFRGRHLIPLLVGELSQSELGDFSLTEAQVRAAANAQADAMDELHASIDGVPVPDLFSHREESPAFSFLAAANNPVGVPTGASGIAVADGYWLMLAPIPAGETHVINFGGGISAFDFRVDVTATITSVPEPSSLVPCGMGVVGPGGYALKRPRKGRVSGVCWPGRRPSSRRAMCWSRATSPGRATHLSTSQTL